MQKAVMLSNMEKAVFAGGCFWCLQPPFDGLKGVVSTMVGYTGGTQPNPTYEQVCSGATGHAEAVEVTYDPSQIAYGRLLDVFWRNIDPTAVNRQFSDSGAQYRTAIFYLSREQKRKALASTAALEKSGKFDRPIATQILPAGPFYPAEEYHQKYYLKNLERYKRYKAESGRADYLQKVWGQGK